MSTELQSISYGKSRVRVAKITRSPVQHEFSDLTVNLQLDGSFEESYLSGDNSSVVPTDTMKNTVHALAKLHPLSPVEKFGQRLGAHFLETHAHVSKVRIQIVEHAWDRLDGHSFEKGAAVRLANLTVTRESRTISAGIQDLTLLKTTDSEFTGYIKDQYTTLKETSDRIFATAVSATWEYLPGEVDFNAALAQIRGLLTSTFRAHYSRAVQETLYAMGDAVLQEVPSVKSIHLSLPNKHYLPLDLSPLGLDNNNEVFLPTDEPYGLIEATLGRSRT